MSTPKDDETNILNVIAESTGNLPLLNRPSSGRTSITGYRTPELASEAVEYVNSIESMPEDVDSLNNDWDGQGTCPSEKIRRGMLEILTAEYLDNVYPEWLGDATDDANACLELINAINGVKMYGWASVMEWVKSDEAPLAWMIPTNVARLLPFKEDEDDSDD